MLGRKAAIIKHGVVGMLHRHGCDGIAEGMHHHIGVYQGQVEAYDKAVLV
jgi:hypothetical protein